MNILDIFIVIIIVILVNVGLVAAVYFFILAPLLVLLIPSPTGLAAAPSSTSMVLTWNPSLGASQYLLFMSTATTGPFTALATVTSPTLTYTATNLTSGTAYSFEIKAVTPVGTSAASAVVTQSTSSS